MNIEEAIKNLKVLIGLEEFNKLSYKENKSIETLLTAYEKEKEKNKELEDTLKQTQNSWYEDTKVIEKQSKEIEELKDMKKELTERVLRLESDKFWDNVVSKDKIKAKIEELEKQQKEEPDAYLCIKVLQSLLEKE